ncbi:MAG TPA: hypothetical protein VGB14_17890 [Acidimicrobiales bacterium]|jgi:hypothetical protein
MVEIGVLILAILVWAWWFDRYRRRPRRGPGAIDDRQLEQDRGYPGARHGFPPDHHQGGIDGGFGGG